jgi:hypothetical protein
MKKSEEKGPRGGPKHRWEDNRKLDLQGIELGLDWTDLAQDRDKEAGYCRYGNEPSGSIKCGDFVD